MYYELGAINVLTIFIITGVLKHTNYNENVSYILL